MRVVPSESGGFRIDGVGGSDGVLVDAFLDHLRVRAFSPLTVRAYAFHVLSFLRFCDEHSLKLSAVRPMDVLDFLDWLARPAHNGNVVVLRRRGGASPATMNQRIAALRGRSSSR